MFAVVFPVVLYRIHVWYIIYIYHKIQVNVNKYTSPMDPMSNRIVL